tara:strand:+ start:109 stop:321 length:213 start_codon:yes stop_codon:yes gene_type:complete
LSESAVFVRSPRQQSLLTKLLAEAISLSDSIRLYLVEQGLRMLSGSEVSAIESSIIFQYIADETSAEFTN